MPGPWRSGWMQRRRKMAGEDSRWGEERRDKHGSSLVQALVPAAIYVADAFRRRCRREAQRS